MRHPRFWRRSWLSVIFIASMSNRDSRDDTLGDSLSESVELRNVSTTLYSESDVDVGKLLGSNDEDGLVDLVSEESTGGQLARGGGWFGRDLVCSGLVQFCLSSSVSSYFLPACSRSTSSPLPSLTRPHFLLIQSNVQPIFSRFNLPSLSLTLPD